LSGLFFGDFLHAISAFASLGLSPESLSTLSRIGYHEPTPIQARALPAALAGHDLIGCAATGTGKTAAFVLPMVERFAGKRGTRGLVLAPTRELAEQISEHLEAFGRGRGVRAATLIGGVSMGRQVDELRRGHEVIVATPGRLIDHLERGTASLRDVEVLVLDEADRMLDMGFKPQLDRVIARLPRQRQTMLFSATMAGEVADYAARHLRTPVRVEVNRTGTTPPRADQCVYRCGQEEKVPLLLALLARDEDSTLIFTRTQRRADKLARELLRAGHEVARIHGGRSQPQRRLALDGFREGQYRVLVATDIAARGLDVEDIGHVVLFDLPHVATDYVHRVGRTARAAASGRATSLCAPDEADLLRDIERLVRAPIRRAEVPRDSPVFVAARQQVTARTMEGRSGSAPRPPWTRERRPSRASGRDPVDSGAALGPSPAFPGRPRRERVRTGSFRPQRARSTRGW
jgi:ATP-dependent RNA helicase RhlE